MAKLILFLMVNKNSRDEALQMVISQVAYIEVPAHQDINYSYWYYTPQMLTKNNLDFNPNLHTTSQGIM